MQVDVVTLAGGDLLNTTGDLTSSAGNSGTASAVLRVIEAVTFTKAFLGAPVLPGGVVTLEYTIANPSASATVTAMTFTDDLAAALPGLAAIDLPLANVCGVGSQLSGSTLLTLTGGALGPGASCTFAATLQLPADAGLPGPSCLTGSLASLSFRSMRKLLLLSLSLALVPGPGASSGIVGGCQVCREWGGRWTGELSYSCWYADSGATHCYDHLQNLCWVDGSYCECITVTP